MDVDPAIIYVTEPDNGENTTVTFCLRALVNTTVNRLTMISFQLRFSPVLSTAEFGSDFFATFSTANITIPTNFSGEFLRCFNLTIIGDDVIESNEVITYNLSALSPLDLVNVSQVTVHILNNDGKFSQLSNTFVKW